MQRSKQEPVEAVFTTGPLRMYAAPRAFRSIVSMCLSRWLCLSRASKLHGWLEHEFYIALPTTLINNVLAFGSTRYCTGELSTNNFRVLEKCMGKATANKQQYSIGARLSWIALEIALVDARSLSDYLKRPRREPLTILQLWS